MTQVDSIPAEAAADFEIKEEIVALGGIYGLDAADGLRAALENLDFSYYAEYVLGERNLEIICGGVGQEQQLMQTAAKLGVPEPLVAVFRLCVARFPRKMVGLKLCFGAGHDQPTLYLTLMEPWEAAFEFLSGLPEVRDSVPELRSCAAGSKICILLAFSLDRKTGHLVVKTYQPFDRKNASPHNPLMLSHRLSDGRVSQPPKFYKTVPWEELPRVNRHMEAIAGRAKEILGGSHQVAYGYYYLDGIEVKPKIYIFRKDSRPGSLGPRTDSIYTAEGMIMLGLERFEDAIESFSNAIAYNGRDFVAHANRGLCYAVLGRHELAIQDARTAQAVDPSMSFRQSGMLVGLMENIVEISEQLEAAPSAGLYNRLGVLLFHRGLFREAKRNFELALALDGDFAEAYNNLGGACINLGRFSDALEYCGKAIYLDGHTDATNYRIALDRLRRSAGAATHHRDDSGAGSFGPMA